MAKDKEEKSATIIVIHGQAIAESLIITIKENSEEEKYTHVFNEKKRDDKDGSKTRAQDSDSGESNTSITSSVEEQHSLQPFKNVVSLDCEIVSFIPNSKWKEKANPLSGWNRKRKKHSGRNEVSVAAHCAVVDYDYKVLYNTHRHGSYQLRRRFCFLFAPHFNEARKRILKD